MCSDPGQELIKQDIRDHGLNRIVVASCSPHLHEKTFRGAVVGRGPQRVPVPDGQHPRARLVGAHRQAGGDGEGRRAGARRGAPGAAPQAAGDAVGPGPAGRARGGGRDRGDPRRAHPGRRRQARLPRRAGADHRRAHGDVRQDLPDAGLRGVHPDAEDDGGEGPQEHQPVGVLGGEGSQRLRGELQGEGPPQAPLHRRGRLHRVPGVHRRVHLPDREVARRVQPGHVEAAADLPPLPAGGAAAGHHRPRSLHRVQVAQVQEDLRRGVRRPERDRLQPAGDGGRDRGRDDPPRHRLQGLRCQAAALLRVRHLSERVHRARGGAAAQRLGADGR